MFTGFINYTGVVQEITPLETGAKLIIKASSKFTSDISIKSNVSIDGRVLTVLNKKDFTDFSFLEFYVSNLHKINTYFINKKVNLERAIRVGEEIPGTFFYGVPTGKVEIALLEKSYSQNLIMKVSFEDDLIKYLSIKDQVCLDGILLQIKDIESNIMIFEIYPNTLTLTNLGERKANDFLSIEIEPFTLKVARIFQKLGILETPKEKDFIT